VDQHFWIPPIYLSLFWQDVLTLKGNSDKQIIVFLKDVSYSDLKALVDYMYKVWIIKYYIYNYFANVHNRLYI
jgi:hypothetical protein